MPEARIFDADGPDRGDPDAPKCPSRANHISAQFSVLVTVVIATAVVPTFIAQRWFSPALPEQIREEVLAQEEESM